jgi:excisionase family DNA binding protein
MMAYTLATAAEAAKVSKPTVFKWIKKGKISATRADDGTYRIDPAELHRYLDSIAKTEPETATQQQPATPVAEAVTQTDTLPEMVALRFEVEKLKALLEMERQRAGEWRATADRLLGQMETMGRLLTDQRPAEPQQQLATRQGFLSRLFRRAG